MSKIISHDFNSATLENNIAILELEDEITFSETVQPISLSTASDTDADTACTVTGWGYTSVRMELILPRALRCSYLIL